MALDVAGVAASSGSACSSGTLSLSHVLLAQNIPEREAEGAIRFSLGRGNTEEDIDATLEILRGILGRFAEFGVKSA